MYDHRSPVLILQKAGGFFNSIDSLFSLILIADFEFFMMYDEAFFCNFFAFMVVVDLFA